MIPETLIAGPYTHQGNSVTRTMSLVMLALLPATLFGFYLFGWPAVFLFGITVASALLFEAISLHLAGKPVRLFLMDGSAVLSSWLLAITLPPWAPWWIGVLGAFLAIVIGKQVFGGIGQNLFNPAMVARVALLISFPLEMTQFIAPVPIFSAGAPGFMESLGIFLGGSEQIDALSGATTLGFVKTELSRGVAIDENMLVASAWGPQFLGLTSGSMGETSSLLLLVGGVYLLMKKVITWYIPVSFLLGITLLSGIFHTIDPQMYLHPATHLFSGGVMLCAFFIATDLVTSPVSMRGQILFGTGCGVLVYVIRTWAAYPEGIAFAVMLMNACTPLIDHYFKPRIYGRDRKGEPLSYPEHGGDSR